MRAIELAHSSREVAALITNSLVHIVNNATVESPVDLKHVHSRLYLISDILFNTANPLVPASRSYRREFEAKLSNVFERLNLLWTTKLEGRLSQKAVKKMSSRVLRLWKEHSIYEARLVEGWEALLKADKANFYAFNLRDGFFTPSVVKDKKLLEKMK